MSKRYKNILFLTLILILLSTSLISAAQKIEKDIIVYSAEPEGITAAVAAAREGKSVLLVMTKKEPGGLMTYGALNFLDLNYDQNSNNINHGIFSEWHQKVGGTISFSPQKAKEVFWEMLNAEDNIEIINSADLIELSLNDSRIDYLKVKTDSKNYRLTADYYIDASQDGDLAAAAEENYFVGTADIGLENQWMASTQILKFSNVEPQKLKRAVKNNRYSSSYFRDNHAWGFSDLGKAYKSSNTSMRMRGLNIVFTEDSESESYDAYINSLLLFGVNPLEQKSINKAKKEAKKEAESILKYLREKLAGFKNAELAELPLELYRRESRHFLTHYQLGVKDQFRQKVFRDAVAIASYPLDYQASAQDYPGFVLFNPEYYTIPLRSLIAYKNKNLMIVGRSSGYSSLAAASARVLPVGMNTAEAAAIAASEAINKNKDLLKIVRDRESIKKIREHLNLNLDRYPSESPVISDKEILTDLEKLLSWGITIGGYNNNFKLTKVPSEKEFTAIILKIMQKKEAKNLYEWVPGSLETLSKDRKLKSISALKLLLAAESQKVLEMKEENYYKKAAELDLIPEDMQDILQKDQKLSRKNMINLAAHYLERFKTPSDLKFIRGEYLD